MLPNETFLQITNCKEDIAFAGNLQVDLIDECEQVVKNLVVNEDFFYVEGTDVFGVKQIAYEFGNLNEDFYGDLLFLRLKHTVSDNTWYSSGFQITEKLKNETCRKEYKNESYFRGIDYSVFPFFQTIRLSAFKTDINPTTESEELMQLTGAKKWLRSITTAVDKYIFRAVDFFTYSRVLAVLNHDIVYIDEYRNNTTAGQLTKGERIDDSNVFEATFETNPTEERRIFEFQLYQGLLNVGKIPLGDYNIGSYNTATAISTIFSLGFNRNVEVTDDIELKVYKDNVLFATFDNTKFTAVGQNIFIDVSSFPVTTSGEYLCVIEPNKIYSGTLNFEGFELGDWPFNILDGDWLNTDWNNADWLTN